MAAEVPGSVTRISLDPVVAGNATSSRHWLDVAGNVNRVLGAGQHNVPNFVTTSLSLNTGITYTFPFRIKPHIQSVARVWGFRARTTDTNQSSRVEANFGNGARSFVVPNSNDREGGICQFVETVATATASETAIDITIKPEDTAIQVLSMWAYDVPRTELLTNGTELGTDLELLRPGQPIAAPNLANIVTACRDQGEGGRRVFQTYSAPYRTGTTNPITTFAISITSASYVDVFDLPLPMLTRMEGNGTSTGNVRFKVYAWVTGGDADIRLNSSKRTASSPVTVSATSPAWSSGITYSVDSEDFTEDDGLRSSTFDEVDLEARKNSGGTLYIAGYHAWEP